MTEAAVYTLSVKKIYIFGIRELFFHIFQKLFIVENRYFIFISLTIEVSCIREGIYYFVFSQIGNNCITGILCTFKITEFSGRVSTNAAVFFESE